MSLSFIAGVMLLLRQSPIQEQHQLCIDHSGSCIRNVKPADYTQPYSGLPLIDDGKLDTLIKQIDKAMYRAPVNATINDSGAIVKEEAGVRLNREAFQKEFYKAYYDPAIFQLKPPEMTIYPKVDSELLAAIRVQPIGYYVTYFNSRNQNRYHNITLAAKAINNYVVLPGETFSFNRVVGVRTPARGYKAAKIIVRGEFSEGIGGGICQISSTLFNAADRAGLKIVERYSHSRSVPYVPPGRDATVNWGGPDFSFTNSYNQPVLIRSQAMPGQVVITIYTSELVKPKPRHVPSASETLPEEIHAGTGVNMTP
ncbi:VanW family protein [Paenibacillus aestuarii]|uniref:VanW family protein n=1 Tax=Paenibacillus aestuarii TaxID=516965 RepID=A0ABW0KEI6_9BACL|nr:VanW family protein [Paenibacillus aestuarii]